MFAWKTSVDDARRRLRVSKSGRSSQYSRSYSEPAIKRWILKDIVIVRGGAAYASG